jgi:glutamate formiminotransferase
MAKLMECVPNFSEGRDAGLLRQLAARAQGVPGAALLDVSADADHNRSVFTLAGSAEAVADAVFVMCELAAERIDLRRHVGEHPRMGAVDVVPFIPLAGSTMQDAAELARQFGKRVWEELGLPVYLYEEAAGAEHRRNLADVRRGQFEGLEEKMRLPEWAPDFGEAKPHPTAGAVAVGARMPLIAFNINLDTPDAQVAKDIARVVRESSGGYPCCKAMGVMLHKRGIAQVSMNMTNYLVTPLHVVYGAVYREAQKRGVGVVGSEIVGLAPAKAFADCAARALLLESFDTQKGVLEAELVEHLL